MFISLYTTRIVLDALGVEDFGVYNVVLSTVTLVSFFIGVLSSSSQRFLTFELGTGNLAKLQSTFSTILSMNVVLSLLMLIIVEFIGLWFMDSYLQIPLDRMEEARAIFHIIVVSMIINIFKTPFYAIVIAYEKMNIFAIISVLEAVLKLFAAYLLTMASFDKLILYSWLLLGINLVIIVIYIVYFIKQHQELKIKLGFDKEIFKKIIGFSGWNTIGGIAFITSTQGLNIVFNIFYGVVFNTAMAIAYQISSAIENIASNLLVATTPQITKLYASNQSNELVTLLYRNSKYAFILIWIFVSPMLFEIEFILKLWLKEVPQYTVEVVSFLLVLSLIKSLSKPLIAATHATGNMKDINITSGTTIISVLPISYILITLGYQYSVAFILLIIAIVLQQFYNIYFLSKSIDISFLKFYSMVIYKLLLVVLVPLVVLYCINIMINESIGRLIFSFITSFVLVLLTSYKFSLDEEEKSKIKLLINTKNFKVKEHK